VRSRGFARVWVSVLAAVLVLGLGWAPAAAGAQAAADHAPAATARGGQAAGAAQSEQGDASTPEDEVQYLHTPVVKALARMLHLSLQVADNLFLAINFLILALGIGVPLGRLLPKMLRHRKQTLSHSLETAREMTQDAEARLGAVEAQLAKLDEEIAAMRGDMEEDLKREEARVKAAMAEESGRIVAGAEQEIAAATAHARRGLRQFAADLAIDKAAKQMVLTAENDRALIAEFVRETTNQGKGGQN